MYLSLCITRSLNYYQQWRGVGPDVQQSSVIINDDDLLTGTPTLHTPQSTPGTSQPRTPPPEHRSVTFAMPDLTLPDRVRSVLAADHSFVEDEDEFQQVETEFVDDDGDSESENASEDG